jgi:hypothetical protein
MTNRRNILGKIPLGDEIVELVPGEKESDSWEVILVLNARKVTICGSFTRNGVPSPSIDVLGLPRLVKMMA